MTFEIVLLGTGCPSVSATRFGPAALVIADGRHLLVDCGSGVTQRLKAAGLSGAAIDAVLLTHLHSDHIIDLFQLVVSSWHQGRDRPHRVFGPPGTRRYVDGLMALWQPELAQRIAHEHRPSTAALSVEVEEIGPGPLTLFEDDTDPAVTVVPVDHLPVRHAFGFVFTAGDRRVAISGDTRYCPALIDAARGADLLLHEVFVHREMPVVPGLRTAETVANVAAYHTLSGEVGKVAAAAQVGALALTHFVPPDCDRGALLAEVAADFPGPVIIGEDLMRFDVVAGTVRHGDTLLALGGPRRRRPAAP